MSMGFLEHESVIRLGCFSVVLAFMGGWEAITPRRVPMLSRISRWPSNLGIVLLDNLVLRTLLPITNVALALEWKSRGFGLLNHFSFTLSSAAGERLKVILAVVILDFVIYLQHVLFHRVPALWRLHRVHHADIDFDVTTALRFHPIEILLSAVIKMGAISLLGAPAVSVLLFEVILNAVAMFNHGNVRIPLPIDRALRLFLVTPDMHRIHHSVIAKEMNSNFGFNAPWWDRLFGTYRAEPQVPHSSMSIGIREVRTREVAEIGWILVSPFRKGV